MVKSSYRSLFLVALLALGLCCVPRTVPQEEGAPIQGSKLSKYRTYSDQLAARASVKIYVTCADGTSNGGSGFAITTQHIVTAKHVIDCVDSDKKTHGQPKTIIVQTYRGVKYDATIDKLGNEGLDVARLVLSTVDTPLEPLVIDDSEIFKGKLVCSWSGLYGKQSCGLVLTHYESSYYAQIWIIPGDSGSIVYDDTGKIIGIVVAYQPTETPATGIFIPAYFWKAEMFSL